ncbi:MAG: NAD(P)/FAD-dependent oxidoreductase, partial [Desulfobacterales bacterium]|nr:NAD(P)/FAD-dependent oxidoreductase [Desulfobacterales bacterium]
AVNPTSGREADYRLTPALDVKDVLVVGGGVAGMEAARVATLRGHRVTLHERASALGGTVNQAAVPKFKKDLRRLLVWYGRQMEDVGVKVVLNSEITRRDIDRENPDAVIVATGARPLVPPIPGVEDDKVTTAVELLRGNVAALEKNKPKTAVVIGGGLSGCETAIWLAQQGVDVFIVEMLDDLMVGGANVPTQVKLMTGDLLKFHGVCVNTGCRVSRVTDSGIQVTDAENQVRDMACDRVVLALGMKADNGLARKLACDLKTVYTIGDCRNPENVMNAIWDGYEVARLL